ncbi:Myb-like DNA-binding domain-containing protein [Spironucleus salmonicida]|uniref:Myb-like DNA-binding domain-containing protein n=1 Tax=Spironucleus salmonicida TaxID=348837 RepID=V6LX09_9EUKA|nr:Myb-like DNA-binding domain-containing protein [Spironucleus salmonicida]|eukprot:EST48773.1 Myb-like DNA-binding domain-containing protein [Spironucleus salmonicida]
MTHNAHCWTAYETQLLETAVLQFGRDWDAIRESALPHLESGSIRNKYYKLGLHLGQRRHTSCPVPTVEEILSQIYSIMNGGLS